MARLIGGLFGKISGKIGDFTLRNMNGKTIVSARPKHVKISMQPQSVAVREKFAVTAAFSKAIAGLTTLREVWNLNKSADLSVYNTIVRQNFNLSSAQVPTINNIITPYGFHSPVTDVSITNEKLTGSLTRFNSVIDVSPNETGISINAVVCLYSPKEEGDSFYNIISLSKDVEGFDFGNPYDFEIGLTPELAAKVTKFNQNIIYVAIAIKSTGNKITRFSRSYSKISE